MTKADLSLDALEKRLNYTFTDPRLLRQALTHSSARTLSGTKKDNERLEFLGDRVLGLTIARTLYAKFPNAPEGELAKRFNGLVRMETCEQVARELGLGQFLILSDSEKLTGGPDKSTILADACEAIMGAVLLDGGDKAAKKLILHLWEPYFDGAIEIPQDPKSALQEWAQSQRYALPQYREVKRSGPDHAPYFVTEVRVGNLTPVQGQGPSKRASQQSAAEKMLIDEKVWKPKSPT